MVDPPTQNTRLVLAGFSFRKDWTLNQLSLLLAVVSTTSPDSLVDDASSGICLEKPALGSLLLVIVETPSKNSRNSNPQKNKEVQMKANAAFFFQVSRILAVGFFVGMRRRMLEA